VEITPEMHERIRTVYEAGVGSGQVNALARELGLRFQTVSVYANRQGWGYTKGPGAQTKKALEMRELASLHCEHFQECLKLAAKNNVSLECHACDRMTFLRDTWQKEVSLANISRSGEGEQPVKFEGISCPVGEGRKKIMEKQTKDEPATQPADKRPTSDVQRPIMNEKDLVLQNPSTVSIEDLPGPKTKGELETRVCSQADCEFRGKPQPIENFAIQPRYGTRFKMCKACLTKRKQAGQRRRQERLREEKKEGKKIRLKDERPTSNVEHRTSNEMHRPLQGRIEIPELPPIVEYAAPELLEVRVLETLLDGLPDVFAKIVEIAKEQERTPGAQVRYLLKTDYRICGTENKQ